jgi:CheY-like chemotaxis protein
MKILFVDDDLSILDSLGKWFESLEHTVITCNIPKVALELFRQASNEPEIPFDVVITDFNMPGWSGLNLAMHIVSACKAYEVKCPIICITGNRQDAVRMNNQSRNPINLILDKGCPLKDIENAIKAVTEKA